MMGEYAMGGGFIMGFGFIFMLSFWGLIFYLIYLFITSNKYSTNSNLPAKEILKNRLAKGEIEKKEYEDLLKEIKNN